MVGNDVLNDVLARIGHVAFPGRGTGRASCGSGRGAPAQYPFVRDRR
jgi:hypothetical protein